MGQFAGQMEQFGARPNPPLEESLAEVDKSDVFVGIYAYRYGTTVDGVSITEHEYNHAVKAKKPVLAFIVDDTADWDEDLKEGEPGGSRVAALKARIRKERTAETFTSAKDLGLKVATSVMTQLAHIPTPAPNAPVSLANIALLHTSWFSAKHTAARGGRVRYYRFDVVVIAPPEVMQRINSVVWRTSDVWPPEYRVRVCHDRADRFRMEELANGTSIVRAEINLDGQPEPLWLNRFIDLREEGPRI